TEQSKPVANDVPDDGSDIRRNFPKPMHIREPTPRCLSAQEPCHALRSGRETDPLPFLARDGYERRPLADPLPDRHLHGHPLTTPARASAATVQDSPASSRWPSGVPGTIARCASRASPATVTRLPSSSTSTVRSPMRT